MNVVGVIYTHVHYCTCVYTAERAPKKKKDDKKKEALKASQTRSAACADWFQRCRVKKLQGVQMDMGFFRIPTLWPQYPEEEIADRKRDEAHVDDIKKSMMEHGILINSGITILMWQDDLDKANIDLHKDTIDVSKQEPPVPMYTIAGDHTCAAAQSLHNFYPANKKWVSLPVSIVVAPKTDSDITFAKLYGGLDNKIRSTHKKKGAWDYVLDMHEMFVRVENSDDSAKDKKDKISKFMDDLKIRSSEPENSIGSWKQVAKQTGKLWDNINAIFSGDTKDKKASIPKNTTHFNGMSGIPEENLVRWSDRVVEGEWRTKDFSDRCAQFKREKLCQSKMMEFTVSKLSKHEMEDGEPDTYDELIDILPFFGDQVWFKKCVAFMGNARLKDELAAQIKDEIMEKMKRHRDAKSKAPVSIHTQQTFETYMYTKFNPFCILIYVC